MKLTTIAMCILTVTLAACNDSNDKVSDSGIDWNKPKQAATSTQASAQPASTPQSQPTVEQPKIEQTKQEPSNVLPGIPTAIVTPTPTPAIADKPAIHVATAPETPIKSKPVSHAKAVTPAPVEPQANQTTQHPPVALPTVPTASTRQTGAAQPAKVQQGCTFQEFNIAGKLEQVQVCPFGVKPS